MHRVTANNELLKNRLSTTNPNEQQQQHKGRRQHHHHQIHSPRHRYNNPFPMLSSSTLSFFLLVVILLSGISSTHNGSLFASGRIFASDNGFDNGGDEPVCWEAVIDTLAIGSAASAGSSSSSVATTTTAEDAETTISVDGGNQQQHTVHTLNEALFDEGIAPKFNLLKSCYEGTNLSMEAMSVLYPKNVDKKSNNNENIMETSIPYTFQMTLSTELQNVNETFLVEQQQSSSSSSSSNIEPMEVWMRLVLCKATQVGFCSPYFDISSSKVFHDTDYVEGMDVLTGIELGIPPLPSNTYIATPWITWYLQPQDIIGNKFMSSVNLTLQLEPGTEGIYFMLGHAVMYFFNTNDDDGTSSSIAYRVDIADALEGNIVQVKSPPTILRVDRVFTIVLCVVVGIATSFALAMFGVIVYHRKNKLMTLAQGGLLGLLTITAAIGNITSLFFFPTEHVYCILAGPLCLVPQTLIAAILVGRLWRVYMTISVANSLGRATLNTPGKTDFMSKFMPTEQGFMDTLGLLSLSTCFPQKNNSGGRSSGRSLRRATTRADTLRLIFMLTLPQIVLQVCGAIVYPAEAAIHLSEDGKLGRESCRRGDRGSWTYFTGMGLLLLVYVLGVLVAWFSRNLPSAFNEKDQIFQAASINSVVSMIIISLMFITNRAETSPHITVFLWVALALSLTTVTTWIIVMPKIRRLFSGEKVVVSNMLRKVNNLSLSSSTSSHTAPTGASLVSPIVPSGKPAITAVDIGPPGVAAPIEETSNHSNNDNGFSKRRKPKIVIKEEDPIPKSVEKEIYAMQSLIKSINDDTLHGRPVKIQDWRALKLRAALLSDEVNRVECDWSADEDGGQSFPVLTEDP